MSLIATLQSKELLSDARLNSISDHFDFITESFQQADISKLDNDEVFFFVYFLQALSAVSKRGPTFYGKLRTVVKLDFLPVLVVKAQLSRNEDIMMILIHLSSIDNFPNKKIVSLLAKCGTLPTQSSSQSLLDSFMARDLNGKCPKRFKHISKVYNEEIDEIIDRINKKLDRNELDLKSVDIAELYRQKVNFLNDQLTSTSACVERISTENAELLHKIVTNRDISEKQEFMNLCMEMDRARMAKEMKVLAHENQSLKESCRIFQAQIDRLDERDLQKDAEYKKAQQLSSKALEETKNRLRLASTENVRISLLQPYEFFSNFSFSRRLASWSLNRS